MKKILFPIAFSLALLVPAVPTFAVSTPAFQSITSGTAATGTCVSNKPASLAVGDLLLGTEVGLVGAGTVTGPSGWTLVVSDTSNSSPTGIWYKIADSSDVAASNFTFTTTGSESVCSVARYTGAAAVTPVDQHNNGVSNATTNLVSSGITPTKTNSLLVEESTFFREAPSATLTTSGWAVANNNPTWTTDLSGVNVHNGTNDYIGIAVAHGSYATTGATGNATATLSASNDNGKLFILNIVPATTSSFNPYFFFDF